MSDTTQALDYNDLMELAQAYRQMKQAGDPRSEKLGAFLNQQSNEMLKSGALQPEKAGAFKAFAGDIKGMLTPSPKSLLYNAVVPGMGSQLEAVESIIKGQPKADYQRRKEEGRSLPYRVLAPAGASVTGVNLPGMEQSANEGDTGGVLGHAAAPVAVMAATAGAAKLGAKLIPATSEAIANSRAGKATSGAIQEVKAAWNPEKNLTPEQAATKAFRPRNSKTNWNNDVQSALPDARRAADTLGIDPENMTMDDALKATSQAKKDVWGEYQKNVLDPAKQSGATVSGDSIAEAIRSKITDRMREQRPGLVARIEKTANTYEGKKLSVGEAQDRLTEANNETRAIEAKYVTDKRAAKQSPTNAYRFAERDTLRSALDDTLNQVSGPGGDALRKRWGALNSMEDVISRRIPVADRANPVSLTRVLELVHGPGRIIRGVATGNLGDIAMGTFNTKRLSNAEMMNNPDWLTQQAFKKTTPTPAAQPRQLRPASGPVPANVNSVEPNYVYRVRNVGEEGIPMKPGHAEASTNLDDVRAYSYHRTTAPQEIVRIDLNKLSPSDFVSRAQSEGVNWIKFNKAIPESALENLGTISREQAEAALASILKKRSQKR